MPAGDTLSIADALSGDKAASIADIILDLVTQEGDAVFTSTASCYR
jgi:uncharacterized phosphosugar-binding protein